MMLNNFNKKPNNGKESVYTKLVPGGKDIDLIENIGHESASLI